MPLDLRHARSTVRFIDSSGLSKGTFSGKLLVSARGGDKLGISIQFTPHGGGVASAVGAAERARMRSFLVSLRGRQNPAWMVDFSTRRRGVFPTSELLSNSLFLSGTSGWTDAGQESSISASSGVMRVTRNAVTSTAHIDSSSVSIVQYAPYVGRAFILRGRGTFTTLAVDVNAGSGATYDSSVGMRQHVFVSASTSAVMRLFDNQTTGLLAGDYYSVSYASLSRCALVDNGSNLLLQSDDFSNVTAWGGTTTNGLSSISANSGRDPTGTTQSDQLTENSSASGHYREQSITIPSAIADYTFGIAIKAGTRSIAWLHLVESSGSTFAEAFINLSNGAVTNVSSGVNMTNARASSVFLGDGWYAFYLTANKANNSTTLKVRVGLAAVAGTTSYTGTGASAMNVWRATAAQSSLPMQLALTTTAAIPATSQTGTALRLKGLPASTAGLLVVDDQVEIVTPQGSELKIVTSRLDSDAIGIGYLQFEPAMRSAPADNAPVIINQPMGQFLFTGDLVSWDNDPGFWSNATADFEEQ